MSYLVLARKYRPQSFADVVGQEHVTRTLANAFEQDRVHHAFLFCGPRGVGKTTAARILAKALSCERGPTPEPCGACAACASIAQGTAVDVLEMDGASNRGIDAIRELTEAVRYQPAILRKKVYVIDEVHMLTAEAFNALLKTLEEPPPHVTFVLATTEPHKLPNTILSRCQRYDFKLVALPRLTRHLESIAAAEELQFEPGALSLIAREAGGSVRDALSLSDQVISYVGDGPIPEATVAEVLGVADRALTRALVSALLEGDAGAALRAVDDAQKRGVDEIQIARAVARRLRDLAVLQAAPGASGLVDEPEEEAAELARVAEGADAGRVREMFERVRRACEDLSRSQQPRLVLDLALIEAAALEPTLPLGDLLERLGDLERRLAQGEPGGGGRRGGGSSAPRAGGRSASAPAGHSASTAAATPDPTAFATADAGGFQPVASGPGGVATADAGGSQPVASGPGGGIAAAEPEDIDAGGASAADGPYRSGPARGAARGSSPPPTADGGDGDGTASALGAGPADAAGVGSGSGGGPAPAIVASPTNGAAAAIGAGVVSEAQAPAGAGAANGAAAAGARGVGASAEGRPAPFEAAGDRPSPAAIREWEELIAGLMSAGKLTLSAQYQEARLLRFGDGAIEVGFPEGDLGYELASERGNIDAMRAFLRERYGAEIAFSVRALSPDEAARARSLVDIDREREEDDRSRREKEVRTHPLTRMVLDTFGATIEEIRPLRG